MAAGRRNLKNNWATTLQADAGAADTTLSLLQDWIDALTDPTPASTQWYELTLDDGVQAPEIVRCTAAGSGTVTVVREQQGTFAPTTWAAGTKVEIRITAELARVLEFSSWDGSNLLIGARAGISLTTGGDNLLLGEQSGEWLTDAYSNIAVGKLSLNGIETGVHNTAIGYEALRDVGGDASDLVAVGFEAGMSAGASVSRSIYLGSQATGQVSDAVVIGYGATADTANTAVLGSSASRISTVYIGGGQHDGAAEQVTLSASAGDGTDSDGGTLRLGGGKPTGSGTPGKVIIAVAAGGGASGSTETDWTDRAEWDSAGLFWTYGGLKTGDPGAGAGTWMLGTVQAGAVTLDTANYVEVDIGGTLVKLLKAA